MSTELITGRCGTGEGNGGGSQGESGRRWLDAWARRLLVSAALVPVLALGLLSTGASPAAASSSSTITSQYWWPHNGCTIVSDSPAWPTSFTYACNHHDGCYALRWSSDRATCDWWFYNDMRAACNGNWWAGIERCYSWATNYYVGVRTFGWIYWNSNSQLTRISTPMA
jgi:hypothetical protein